MGRLGLEHAQLDQPRRRHRAHTQMALVEIRVERRALYFRLKRYLFVALAAR